MEGEEHDKIVDQILKGVPASTSTIERTRLIKARLRWLGDEIGEPILLAEGHVPEHYVVVEVPVASSLKFLKDETVPVAMTPKAAEIILARC
jgi:hypothetical protein